MNTCAECNFFRLNFGETKGKCWAMLPTKQPGGFTTREAEVKGKDPACHVFKPLPEGAAPAVKSKVNPETPGQAIRAARQATKPALAK